MMSAFLYTLLIFFFYMYICSIPNLNFDFYLKKIYTGKIICACCVGREYYCKHLHMYCFMWALYIHIGIMCLCVCIYAKVGQTRWRNERV